MVSLAYEKRAIPLLWRCYIAHSSDDYPAEGQVGMIEALVLHVVSALLGDSRLLVLADRGIGYSSDLMPRLRSLGMKFVLRISRIVASPPLGCISGGKLVMLNLGFWLSMM